MLWHTLGFGLCNLVLDLTVVPTMMMPVPTTSFLYDQVLAIVKFQLRERWVSNLSAHQKSYLQTWIQLVTCVDQMESKKTSTMDKHTESTTCGTTRPTWWNSRLPSKLLYALLLRYIDISNSISYWTKKTVLTHTSYSYEPRKKIITFNYLLFSIKVLTTSSLSSCQMPRFYKFRARQYI